MFHYNWSTRVTVTCVGPCSEGTNHCVYIILLLVFISALLITKKINRRPLKDSWILWFLFVNVSPSSDNPGLSFTNQVFTVNGQTNRPDCVRVLHWHFQLKKCDIVIIHDGNVKKRVHVDLFHVHYDVAFFSIILYIIATHFHLKFKSWRPFLFFHAMCSSEDPTFVDK